MYRIACSIRVYDARAARCTYRQPPKDLLLTHYHFMHRADTVICCDGQPAVCKLTLTVAACAARTVSHTALLALSLVYNSLDVMLSYIVPAEQLVN